LSFIPDYNNENSKNQNNQKDNEIEKLKKEIIKLNNENSSLKDENHRLKNEIKRLKSELNNNIQNLKKYELEINKLNLALSNKNDEINNLNDEIKNLKLNSGKKKLIDIDEMLVIQFKSIDQKVDMSYACQKDDIFVRIEEKLYNDYPQFKDLNTYFTVNGRIVKRFRSMLENGIRNNDKILLNIYE
jgi:predicted RNase H-like nuclease (RuvC/YqgF family)